MKKLIIVSYFFINSLSLRGMYRKLKEEPYVINTSTDTRKTKFFLNQLKNTHAFDNKTITSADLMGIDAILTSLIIQNKKKQLDQLPFFIKSLEQRYEEVTDTTTQEAKIFKNKIKDIKNFLITLTNNQ